MEMRVLCGKMEVIIYDFEWEIEFLWKEKYDIKVNYK